MKSNLELLLLTLVRDGFGTPYELKSKADISLGSAIPALARLETDGLVKASDPQARRSRRFAITSKGLKTLESEWAEQLNSTTTDVESVLRIAYLGWLHGSADSAASFLEASAERLRGLATMADAEATRFGRRGGKVDNEAMRWLRARVGGRRIKAEADELIALAKELKKTQPVEKPAARKKRPTRTARKA